MTTEEIQKLVDDRVQEVIRTLHIEADGGTSYESDREYHNISITLKLGEEYLDHVDLSIKVN